MCRCSPRACMQRGLRLLGHSADMSVHARACRPMPGLSQAMTAGVVRRAPPAWCFCGRVPWYCKTLSLGKKPSPGGDAPAPSKDVLYTVTAPVGVAAVTQASKASKSTAAAEAPGRPSTCHTACRELRSQGVTQQRGRWPSSSSGRAEQTGGVPPCLVVCMYVLVSARTPEPALTRG